MNDAPRRISGIAELKTLVGQPLGTSPWFTIDQERIDRFADATLDHQWIHLDSERAERESPYGATVAHGYLTLSMLPHLRDLTYQVSGLSASINYGLGKVRFPAPVRSGSRIRAAFTLNSLQVRSDGGAAIVVAAEIETEGEDRPACVAETIGLLYS